MPRMRRSARRQSLLRQLEDFREMAFPTPAAGDVFEHERLVQARDAVIRARVLLDSTLIEEMLALILMHYWLSSDKRFMQLKYFGRNSKYMSMYEAIGRLTARHKLRLVRTIVRPRRSVTETAERVLALRDVFAHVHTVSGTDATMQYKGLSMFSKQGFQRYLNDSISCVQWLVRKWKRVS